MPSLRQLILDNPKASDDEIAALYNVPVYTRLRPDRITGASVASILGRARAKELLATLSGAADQGNGDAMLALSVLNGTGFEPADPESQGAVADFVAAKIITQLESDRILHFEDANVGTPIVADQVKGERVAMAGDDVRQWVADQFERIGAATRQAINDGVTDKAKLAELFAAEV